MATLFKIATAYAVLALTRPEGRFLRYSGTPGIFSGGGLASALWSFDWPASTIFLPQVVFLTSFLLLVAAMNGGSGISELAGAKRALGL